MFSPKRLARTHLREEENQGRDLPYDAQHIIISDLALIDVEVAPQCAVGCKRWGLFSYKHELFVFINSNINKNLSALCFGFLFEALLLRLRLLLQTPGHLQIMKYSSSRHIIKLGRTNPHCLEAYVLTRCLQEESQQLRLKNEF